MSLLLIAGIVLRINHPDYYSLGFDQVQILQNAQQIAQKHFVLLGPRTGPAPMFTGPLIYYVTAGLLLFNPTPFVLVLTSLSLYLVTFLVLAALLYRYVDDESLIWLIAAFYALSPYQVALDRVPWNPNLTFMAAALVFLPLLHTAGKKIGVWESLCVLMGCFLGYQAHFSGLLLPLFVIVSWLIWYRKQWWLPICGFIGLGLSLVPTAVFDYRHEYVNLRGFLFIVHQGGTAPGLQIPWYLMLRNDLLVMMENFGKLVLYTAPHFMLVALGLAVFSLFIVQKKSWKVTFVWPVVWVLFLCLIFVFYKGSKPEYYFLLQFPALLYILASSIRPAIKSKLSIVVVILVFGLYSFSSLLNQQQKAPSLNIKNQYQAAEKVRQYQHDTNSLIVYDVQEVDAIGLKYLLSDLPSGSATTSTQTTHLIFPYFHDSPVTNEFGELAVWQDPRTDALKNYLVRKQLVLVTPKETILLENHYPQSIIYAADTSYEVERSNQKIAALYFVDDKQANGTFNTFMDSFMKQWDRAQKKWQPVKIGEQAAYVRIAAGTTLIMVFTDPKMNTGDQVNFLNTMKIL